MVDSDEAREVMEGMLDACKTCNTVPRCDQGTEEVEAMGNGDWWAYCDCNGLPTHGRTYGELVAAWNWGVRWTISN